jgi:hypothetical protein
MRPEVSVVMPVHNAMPHLDAAVASMLAQTFRLFEFVILDDGSTDGSRKLLRRWAERDGRIRLIESDVRSGPVASSNRVVAEACAPLIARMDADDVSDPCRLERQMEVMGAHPEAVLVGSLFETIDAAGRRIREADLGRLLRRSYVAPFAHSTILFRRSAFDRAGGYRGETAQWEDVDLYRRLERFGPMLVIPTPLVQVRVWEANSRLGADPADLETAMDAMYRAVEGAPARDGAGLLPQAFVAAGSVRLWSGRRPGVLARLLRRGALTPNPSTAKILAWAALAEASPRSLVTLLRLALALRNRAARPRLSGVRCLAWRPGRVPA